MGARIVLVLALLAIRTSAWGVIFIPHRGQGSASVSSDAQRALILWRDGQETLHVKASYRGPASEFAWVVPVPARPTVAKSDWTLFESVERATRPHIVIPGDAPPSCCLMCMPVAMPVADQVSASGSVTVIESLDIAELRTDVVHATEGAGLIDWLRERGFHVDGATQSTLQAYVDKGFFFVVSTVRPEATAATDMLNGAPTPLAITFPSPNPFLPLAVPAPGAAAESELLLLLVTPTYCVPSDYPWVFLDEDDVSATLSDSERTRMLQWGSRPTALDFHPAMRAHALDVQDGPPGIDLAPAVRRAQGTNVGACLVLESRDHGYWRLKDGKLEPYDAYNYSQSVAIQRYHALLSPKGMRDIAFRPVTEEDIQHSHEGTYWISRSSTTSGRLPRVAVSALGIGLVATLLSWRAGRCSGLLRAVATFGLLAGLAIGL